MAKTAKVNSNLLPPIGPSGRRTIQLECLDSSLRNQDTLDPIGQENAKTVYLATEAQAHGPGGLSSPGAHHTACVWQLRVEARLGTIVATHAEPLISFRSR